MSLNNDFKKFATDFAYLKKDDGRQSTEAVKKL